MSNIIHGAGPLGHLDYLVIDYGKFLTTLMTFSGADSVALYYGEYKMDIMLSHVKEGRKVVERRGKSWICTACHKATQTDSSSSPPARCTGLANAAYRAMEERYKHLEAFIHGIIDIMPRNEPSCAYTTFLTIIYAIINGNMRFELVNYPQCGCETFTMARAR
jgi:hypothetical protein